MSVYVGFKIGKAMERKAYISEYYCGACGWPVSDHDSYCPECGGAFRKEDATERTCKIESCKEFDERGIWAIELSCGHADVYCVMRPNHCSCCGAKVVE